MKVYFSHPSLAYHTPTEEYAIRLIKDELGAKSIINPYDYRGKDKKRLGTFLESSDAVVGMSVYETYPYIVWNDLEFAQTLQKDIYTLTFPSDHKEKIELIEGIVDEFAFLDAHETDEFYNKILKRQSKGLLSTLLFGKLAKKDNVF
ncbi:MAG TPA: hypothetical protein ENN11_03320 [Methanomicrobia archaeon]|nr:hypothetical protein [Methanomicrobia archaeon]